MPGVLLAMILLECTYTLNYIVAVLKFRVTQTFSSTVNNSNYRQ